MRYWGCLQFSHTVPPGLKAPFPPGNCKSLRVEGNVSGDSVELVTLVGGTEIITEINGNVSRSDSLGKNEFEGFSLCLMGLDTGIANIRNLYLRTVKHLRILFVRCLRMIMSRLVAELFSVRCLCGHFQDHSIVGRSSVGNSVPGSRSDLRVHNDLRDICIGFIEPLIAENLNIQ